MKQASKLEQTDHKSGKKSGEVIQPDELLTIAEVAEYLKLSQRTAWRWCKSGQLPAFKVGHQWRVTQRDLKRFIDERS